jgi:Bacterial SH3 domain
MIHATALENRGAPLNDDVDADPSLADRKRRLPYLIFCAAALIVAGGGFLAAGLSLKDPLVVAADSAPGKASRVVATAATDDAPARSFASAELGDLEPTGVEGNETAEVGTAAAAVTPAASDERWVATPAIEQPVEAPGFGAEIRSGGAAEAPPPLPPAETGWTVDEVNASAVSHMARIVSGVNMRAGPSNGHAVLATIPRGSPVEVIDCRQWCEVIFAGQRGWVYKSFIAESPVPGGR